MKENMSSILFAIFVLTSLVNLATCDPKFGADNVCNRTTTVKKEKIVEVPIKYDVSFKSTCGIWPCTETKTFVRMDSQVKLVVEDIQVATCCPGYAETPDRQCAAICLSPCKSGKCVRPGVCQCNPEPTDSTPGFTGLRCDRYTCLALNRWGSKCDRECNCPQNSYCSASTGKCICRIGWRGANCTEECDPTMDCDDLELPSIVEPEVNAIPEIQVVGPTQKLIASRNFVDGGDVQIDDAVLGYNYAASMSATHICLYVFFCASLITTIYALLVNRRKLQQVKNELYDTAYSSSSSSGGDQSNYSGSTYSNGNNLLRLSPQLEPNSLSKNLSFASATRSTIFQKSSNDSSNKQLKHNMFVINPETEFHLMKSQKISKNNIYSVIEPSARDRSTTVGSQSSMTINIPEERTRNIISNSFENDYQVPRIQSSRAHSALPPRPEPSPERNESYDFEDSSEIYEEIKPTSPAKTDI